LTSPIRPIQPLRPVGSARPVQSIPPVHPSRLPRDEPLLGPDGLPATRWTDPRVAAAYADRDDDAECALVWPLIADAVRPAVARRVSGRPDGIVLELGCGLGGLARYLADEHWLRVYAFDVSPTMHRLGAAKFRDAWVVRTLPDPRGRIPLRRAQCTAGIIQRLLLHLAHPCLIIGLLTEARRVLRSGAPLVIVEADTRDRGPQDGEAALETEATLETATDAEAYVEQYRLRGGTTLSTTAWRYSPETIVSCLTSAGFTTEEIQPLSVPAQYPEPATVAVPDFTSDPDPDSAPKLSAALETAVAPEADSDSQPAPKPAPAPEPERLLLYRARAR
jgi:SAM-dependent methyltransferase